MTGKIAIRNIPEIIWAGLESLAAQHDRSVEAEARYALRAWVEPLTQREERNARRIEVSARLRDLLEKINKLRHRPLKPSHIAQAIGENKAEETEDWFIGKKEPSFKQLEAIADYLGAEKDWLQHGDRHMFPVDYSRIPEGAAEGVKWLLNLGEDEEKLSHLHIVREEGETGSLIIVKQYSEWRCKTFTTPYHVSEVIGGGGESSLAHLSVVFQMLYKYYTSSLCPKGLLVINSYILPQDEAKALREGNTHPLTILRNEPALPWWEDFWDVSQFRKSDGNDYWEGWKKFCERIYRAVESKPHLHEERRLIKSGSHPFLSDPPLIPKPTQEVIPPPWDDEINQ